MIDSKVDIQSHIHTLSFAAEIEKERAAARKLSPAYHPPKMHLHHLQYIEDENVAFKGQLTLYFNKTDYLGHRVLRNEMTVNPELEDEFLSILYGLRGNADLRLTSVPSRLSYSSREPLTLLCDSCRKNSDNHLFR